MAPIKITVTVAFLLLLITVPMSTGKFCKWFGIAPFCFIANSCPDRCVKTLESKKGDRFTCWFSHKNYCCCLPKTV